MKKLFFLTFTLALLSATSCKKDYTCTCVDSDDGAKAIEQIPKSSKSEAQKNCSEYDHSGSGYTTTCTIK